MFDTIAGLPIHPLVVHAVVVLAPLAALCLLAYVFRPGWRVGLRWPTLGLALVAALSAAVASSSGESLQHRVLQEDNSAAAAALVHQHVEAGDLAALSVYVLAGIAVVVVLALVPARKPMARGLATAGTALALAASLFLGYGVVNAGHTGAKSAWGDLVSNTTGGGG